MKPSSSSLCTLCLCGYLLLSALFLSRQLFTGRSLVPFDLLPGTTPWKLHRPAREPPWNPLLDSLQQYYPRRVTFNDSVRRGHLPLWNPDVYCGVPFLATQQSAVLYPPGWLLALFPAETAFTWSAVFHLALAGFGMFLWLRRLGLGLLGSLAGGIAVAFNGFTIVWLAFPNVTQWTWCWLPLILYAWERGTGGPRPARRWLALAALLLALQFLGGHAQISAYVLLAFIGWVVARALGARKSEARAQGRRGAGAQGRRGAGAQGRRGAGAQGRRGAGESAPTADATSLPQAPRPPAPLPPCTPASGARPAPLSLLGAGALVLLAGAFAAAGQLLPAWEFVPQTDRGGRVPWDSLAANAFPPAQLVTFIIPRFFGDETAAFGNAYWGQLRFIEMTHYPGIIALVLAGAAFGAFLRRPGGWRTTLDARGLLTLYFAGMVLLGILMATRSPLYWLFWRYVPGFGQITAVARALCLAGWGIAGLAALGLDALLDDSLARSARRGACAGAVLLALGLASAIAWEAAQPVRPDRLSLFHSAVQPLVLPQIASACLWLALGAGLAALAGRASFPAARLGWLLALMLAADLFTFGVGYKPAADPGLARRDTPEINALAALDEPYRFHSYGRPGHPQPFRDRMSPNLPSLFGIHDLHGSDSFFPLRYLEAMSAFEPPAYQADFPRPDAPFFRSLAARYLLQPTPSPPPGFRPVTGALFESPDALPYARVHTSLRIYTDRAALLEAIPALDPIQAHVLAPDAARARVKSAEPSPVTPLRASREGPGRMVLSGTIRSGGLAVIAESYNAGWRATVGGRPVGVVPVNHMLLGVALPAGEHRLELRFEPASVRAGLFLSLLTLAGLLGAAAAGRGVREPRGSPSSTDPYRVIRKSK